MRTFLSLFFLSTAAFANLCLSTGTGNWNDSSKWSNCGGGVPGDGDMAKIAQGHTITIPAGYHAIVGLSFAGGGQAVSTFTSLSAAITTTGQTAITVASGATISNGQYIMLQKEGANTNEIVQVSAGGGTTSLTVVRAQLGTAASLHASAAVVDTGAIPAISCNGGSGWGADGNGILNIADTGWLTFRGNVEQCTAAWNVGKSAIIEHDSSLAASPSTTHYKWVIGSYLFPDAARLVIRGALGNRTLIRNATGSGTFAGFTQYYGAAQGSGQFDFEYATITGCGTTTCAIATGHTTGTALIGRCDHCLVTNSGCMTVSFPNPAGPANVSRFTNSSFTQSANGSWQVINVPANGAGDSVVDTVYTDGQIVLSGNNDSNATGTHLRNIVIRVLTHTGSPDSHGIYMGGAHFQVAELDRLLRITDSGSSTGKYVYLPGGNLTRIMGVVYSASNPHNFNGPAGISGATDTVDGGWFENSGGGGDGDAMGSGIAGKTVVRNTIMPCPLDTGIAMSLLNMATSTTRTFEMWNNTYCGKDDGAGSARGFGFEMAGTAPVGMLAAARNNIVFCATPSACYLVHQGPTGTDSVGTYANVDYNWKWNVSTGPYYQAAGTPYTSYNPNPPGAHDSTGDPQFVQQRHFLDWGQMMKPSISTWSDIVAEFAKMNDDTGFDSRFTILNAYNWLRAGYVPRNAAVYTAGDTGGQVGAMNLIPSMLAGRGKAAGPSVIK